MKPKLSIIIPVKNNRDLLKKLLIPKIRELYKKRFEIIIVDDGSNENCIDLFKNFPVKLVRIERSKGPAYARNLGVKYSKSDYLIFIDSDIEINIRYIKYMYSKLRENKEEVFIGLLDKNTKYKNLSSIYENFYMHYNYLRYRGDFISFYTSFAGINKKLFLKLKGFDTHYKKSSIEDLEFGQRLVDSGVKIIILRKIKLKHHKQIKLYKMCYLNYQKAKGAIRVVCRNKKRLLIGAPNINYQLSIPIFLIAISLLLMSFIYRYALLISLLMIISILVLNMEFIMKFVRIHGSKNFFPCILFFFATMVSQGIGIVIGIVGYGLGDKY